MKHAFALILFYLLSACSGGSGSAAAPAAPGFDELFARATADQVTFFAALPPSGSAQYQGTARLNLPLQMASPQPYLGDLAITITFGTTPAPVSGTIAGLQGAGGAVTGVLQLAGGQLYPDAGPSADYQFTASLAGNLVQNGVNHDLNGVMTGDFTGQSGATVAGLAYGTIETGPEVDLFDGAFVADRQMSGG